MPTHPFTGVLPAVTTPFLESGAIDHQALARQVRILLEHDCSGIVACGSLGEGATLSRDERDAVIGSCFAAARGRPVIAGIGAASTSDAVAYALGAQRLGCAGVMVLPPYIYTGDGREIAAHVGAVCAATSLPCMLYNNPAAYRTDITPSRIAELARAHANLCAVKESSGDVRRITALLAQQQGVPASRLAVGVGIDDLVVEGIAAGASFWVSGLADALPHESVQLFRLAEQGRADALVLLRWLLPLLRFDAEVKFVQYIKLMQERCGIGPALVRPPRLPLTEGERHSALTTLESVLANRPAWTPAGSSP